MKDKELLSGYLTAAADMTREYLVTLKPDSSTILSTRSWTPAVDSSRALGINCR